MVPVGTVVGGDYCVERLLASGGMGEVYVAQQLSTEKKRALKLMHEQIATVPELAQRFAQEACIGARILSEHVVEVIAAGVDAALGRPWLAMELLPGESLAERAEGQGALPPAEVLGIFKQLCHALAEAHDSSRHCPRRAFASSWSASTSRSRTTGARTSWPVPWPTAGGSGSARCSRSSSGRSCRRCAGLSRWTTPGGRRCCSSNVSWASSRRRTTRSRPVLVLGLHRRREPG